MNKASWLRITYCSGVVLACAMACAMVLSTLGLACGLAPGAGTAIAAFVLAAVATGACVAWPCREGANAGSRDELRACVRDAALGAALAALVCLCALALAGLFADTTYDGNSYQKLAVVALRDGWNPLRESIVDWPPYAHIYTYPTRVPLWLDHYPQGLWQLAACLYALAGTLECAKAYTLMAMWALGTALHHHLVRRGVNGWAACGIALAAAVNPITLAQLGTFYVDGFLMMMLGCLLAGMVAVADDDLAPERPCAALLLACAFVCCAGTKFTGLAYAGVFALAGAAWYLWLAARGEKGFSPRQTAGLAGLFAGMLAVGVLVVGFSSYVTNTLQDGHPFYPLMGEGATDIMAAVTPAAFEGLPAPARVALATFSATSVAGDPVLKFPLAVGAEELASLNAPDVRLGGFGVFSGALCVCGTGLYVAMVAVAARRRWRTLLGASLVFGVPALACTLLLSDGWWARYSCYAYFANVLVLVFCAYAWHAEPAGARKVAAGVAGGVFAVLVAANTVLCAWFGTVEQLRASRALAAQLEDVAAQVRAGGTLVVAYADKGGTIYLPGYVFTLDDAGIPYVNAGPDDGTFAAQGEMNSLLYRLDAAGAGEPVQVAGTRKEA